MYQNYERRIEAKLEKIEEFKARATSITISFGEKVQTSKNKNGTEKIISIYLDMQNELKNEVERLHSILKDIKKNINSLQDENQKEILERKYINGESFSKIAEKMYISERQIFRIHGKALEKINLIIDKS